MNHNIDIPSIGIVLVVKNKRAKNMSISISNSGKIRVVIPPFITIKEATKFACDKAKWINRNLSKISNKIHLEKPDKEIARRILTDSLNELCDKHNFCYNKLFIRNQKTIWGSCSSNNNIYLNAKLIHLPNDLLDYVLLHELVHTEIKNHSKMFWDR